jgi:hypothetical protein
MFHSHKHLSILFAGIFGLLLLSGCGSDDEEKQKDAPETGQTDQSATEPAGNQQTPATETGEPAGTAGSSTPKWEAPTTAGDSVAHPYVTDDFHAAIIVRAKNLYESELMKQIRALDKDGTFEDAMVISLNRETGVDIRDVQRFSLFTKSLPGGPGEMPKVVMVLEFSEAADRSDIAQKTTGVETPQEEGGLKWYIPEDGSRYEMLLCVVNDKTLVYSTELALAKKTITAPAADTPLNKRLVELDYSNQHITVVGSNAILPLALLAKLQRELGSGGLPPTFSDITDVIAQLTAASLVVNLSPDLYVKLGLETTSAETTTKLQTMTNDALVLIKTGLGALVLIPPKEMPESVKKMIPDVLKVLAQLKIEQQDKRFEVAIRIPESILTGFMAPVTVAVAEARGAARNMTSMNNLKQIGIATHNFHETYGRFPVGEFPGDDGLIKYKDGKPLLSWRVYLLPFIGEGPLYDQFKLDESWDSPHNLALLDEMPAIYNSPTPPGSINKTRYLAPADPFSILGQNKKVGFRDITDGSSRTIMLVEAGADKAVPWTKPEDLTYDPKDPVSSLGDIGDHFTIGLADGSVFRLKSTIDATSLINLFRRNDGNAVNLEQFRK